MIGLLVAYVLNVRDWSVPLLHVVSVQVVRLADVRIDDWIPEHGTVLDVVVLGDQDLLVKTSNQLIMCRVDDEVTIIRRQTQRASARR